MEAKDALAEDVEAFLDHLRTGRGCSEHTTDAYRRDLRKAQVVLRGLGVERWDEADASHLLAFEATLCEEAPTTVARRVSAVRSLLKHLRRSGAEPIAELPSLASRRRPQALPKALSYGQLTALLDAPDLATPEGLRDRALMELIYGAGLRVSEAVGLARSDLDLEHLVVRVVGKREKVRLVPLAQATARWIELYLRDARPRLARTPLTLVLLSDTGKPLARQRAYTLMSRYAEVAGISQAVGPHTLRHSYAVHLVQGGADLRVVQELLGHVSISTTQVYTGLDLGEVRKRYDRAHPRA